MGAVGGLLVRQLESELAEAHDELAKLRSRGRRRRQAVRVRHEHRFPGARAGCVSSFSQTAGVVVCRSRMGSRRGAALSPAVALAAGRRRRGIIDGTPAHDTSVPRRLAGAWRRAGARDLGRSEGRSGAKRRGAVHGIFLLWRARGRCASELVLRPIPIAVQRLGRLPDRSGAWAAGPRLEHPEARRCDPASPELQPSCRLERARGDDLRRPSQGRDRRCTSVRRVLDCQGEWSQPGRASRLEHRV